MGSTLVVSDLHADPKAVQILARLVETPGFVDRFGSVERVLNLGDAVGRGSAPKQLLETFDVVFDDVDVVWVKGNHEQMLVENGRVLSGGSLAARAHQSVLEDPDLLDRLRGLPARFVDGDVLAVHGGPVDPERLDGDLLSSRPWQRIRSETGSSLEGYQVTPTMAFDALEDEVGVGGLLLSGHEHEELLRIRDGDGPRRPETTRVDVATEVGRIQGRVLARDDRSAIARVGMASTQADPMRFGVLAGDDVALLGLHWDETV